MKIFIDTNILLDLYQLSGPDLDELKKIVKLAETAQITVLLPQQVADEFWRNRERVIRESLDTFKKSKAEQFLPNIVRSNPKIVDLKNAVDQVNSLVKQIKGETDALIDDHNLGADSIIESLFEQCPPQAISAAVIERARLRKALGNPPGKVDSLGDAANWEWLLDKAEDFDDLIVISNDGDFLSELRPATAKEFLQREWKAKTSVGDLKLFRSLPEFLQANFPDIKLSDEIDKLAAIEKLEKSLSFAATHNAIAKLNEFDDFTDADMARIAAAYKSNNQIHMIFGDSDVVGFAKKIIALPKSQQAIASIAPIMELLDQIEPEEDEDNELVDFPF